MAELKLENIDFSYGKNKILNDINLSLSTGVTALLGPNGAGKTTLINIITALYRPDKGTVYYNEKDIKKLRDRYYDYIGYLPQMPQFYKNFTAYNFLEYIGILKAVKKSELKERIERLLKLVNLSEEKNKKIGAFSGGMRQRLGIAQALLNNPEVLILDEPTAGLDPNERIRFRNIISQIGADKIVILATHIVSDVECIASRAIFLKNKEAIMVNNISELSGRMSAHVWRVVAQNENEINYYTQKYLVSNIRQNSEKNGYELKIISDIIPSENAVHEQPGLEDAFLYFYGKKIEEAKNAF